MWKKILIILTGYLSGQILKYLVEREKTKQTENALKNMIDNTARIDYSKPRRR